MTIYRATVLDTPGDPFAGDPAAALAATDGGLLVRDGVIVDRGLSGLRAAHPDEQVIDLAGGLLLPGFVDTHVHFPQMRAIGGLGMPLLDWLERVRAAGGGPAGRPRLRPRGGRGSSSTACWPRDDDRAGVRRALRAGRRRAVHRAGRRAARHRRARASATGCCARTC